MRFDHQREYGLKRGESATMNITELNGVGAVTEERCNEAGVESVEDLTEGSKSEMIERLSDAGVSDNKANSLVNQAKEELIIIQSGEDVVQEYDEQQLVPTGIGGLDDLLGGGWEPGLIAAISGGSGGGKTQVCFQAMTNAVEETGKPAVYIETEPKRYRPKRLANLASEEETQSKINRIKANDLDSQLKAISKVKNTYSEGELSMVVIDSFTARFRLSDDFETRADLQSRSKLIGKHLTRLERLASKLDIPVIITAQVYGNPGGYGAAEAMYGGSLMQHTVGCVVYMQKAQGSLRKATLTGHPGQEDGECHVTISDEGVRSVDAD